MKKGVKGENGGKFGREWYQLECPKTYSRDGEKTKSNWVVSMLTIVKIMKPRGNYNSKWSFGLSSKGTTPAIPGPLDCPLKVPPLQFLQVQN